MVPGPHPGRFSKVLCVLDLALPVFCSRGLILVLAYLWIRTIFCSLVRVARRPSHRLVLCLIGLLVGLVRRGVWVGRACVLLGWVVGEVANGEVGIWGHRFHFDFTMAVIRQVIIPIWFGFRRVFGWVRII